MVGCPLRDWLGVLVWRDRNIRDLKMLPGGEMIRTVDKNKMAARVVFSRPFA